MTKHSKPLIQSLKGERVDPPPIWLMRQAGRYLPEYRKIREKSRGFLDLCYDSDKATQITLQPIKRFDFDAAILFSDILLLPHALGQGLSFNEGEGPRLDAIRSLEDLEKLSLEHLHTRLAPIYQTVQNVSALLPKKTALIGFAGAPWTVAAYMVEGKGSRDFIYAKTWALGAPKQFQRLITLLVKATSSYLIQQVERGADALQIFDTWSGVLPRYAFVKFCIEPILEIINRVKEVHPDIPIVVFPRGATVHLPEFVKTSEVDAISIDYSADPAWAAGSLQDYATIQGNLDPVLLLAGGLELTVQARQIVKALSNGPHIFNLGHGILPETPIKHVEQLVSVVRTQ
ncbi:MAG: uroporphyrinogen decarboxylase [Pseudomonadota bacterium]|nr:uroporphyrinogen decarboxylase [Pseudomonadota bacterium]